MRNESRKRNLLHPKGNVSKHRNFFFKFFAEMTCIIVFYAKNASKLKKKVSKSAQRFGIYEPHNVVENKKILRKQLR